MIYILTVMDIQWTRYAACEFGHESIRVNSISPGPFPSANVQSAAPNFISKFSEKVPMGRVG
jgi:NAD(P)-dependent dehydrogenase (short-subunit alcohol dehydrogenase family)